jgi:hypothetical protein
MNEPTPPSQPNPRPGNGPPTTDAEDELVSSVLDGEASTTDRATVDDDARLRDRLASFSRVQELDAAIVELDRHRGRRRLVAALAAAAALVVVVPLLAIALGGGGADDVASSGPDAQDAAESQAADSAAPSTTQVEAPTSAAGAAPDLGDLGAVGSVAELAAVVTARTGGRSAEGANDRAVAPTTTAPSVFSESQSATRLAIPPCSAAIAAADPSLGVARLTGTARLSGEPVLVLVYAADEEVMVVARPDCTVLDRSRL